MLKSIRITPSYVLTLSIVLISSLSILPGSGQNFYDIKTIQKIEITFSQNNWDYQLDTSKAGAEGYIMAKSVAVNGVVFDSVGIKYKGNSTYNANQKKNPFHIELNTYKEQDYQGYTDIKLSNSAKSSTSATRAEGATAAISSCAGAGQPKSKKLLVRKESTGAQQRLDMPQRLDDGDAGGAEDGSDGGDEQDDGHHGDDGDEGLRDEGELQIDRISGSGPAYIFYVVEAMIEAGVVLGMPRPLATELVVQTLFGAATMIRETGQHPTVLREQVTSPGGTTAAALRALDDHKVRAAFITAMEAAAQRSKELASG